HVSLGAIAVAKMVLGAKSQPFSVRRSKIPDTAPKFISFPVGLRHRLNLLGKVHHEWDCTIVISRPFREPCAVWISALRKVRPIRSHGIRNLEVHWLPGIRLRF